MFQFPSNGKVRVDFLVYDKFGQLNMNMRFQFPSNGKVRVDKKKDEEKTVVAKVSIPFKREGKGRPVLLAVAKGKKKTVSIPFKREGKGRLRKKKFRISRGGPGASFNSLQTGRVDLNIGQVGLWEESFNSLQTGR